MASAGVHLADEQSVPTASNRLPLRTSPLAMGYLFWGVRTSTRRVPDALAAATQLRAVLETVVQARGDVETLLQRLGKDRHPLV